MRDDSAASCRQPDLSSALRIRVGLSILVHSLMLSSQLLVCLPLFLPPASVPWRTVFGKVSWRAIWPNQASFLLFMMVRRASCGPAHNLTCSLTKSLVLRSLQEIPRILLKDFVSNVWILLVVSAVSVQLSQPYSRMDRTSAL